MDEALLERMSTAGVEVEKYHPLALVQPGPPQQSHPPQAAGRRRARRVHRRRRHRRQWQRQRARIRTTGATPTTGWKVRPWRRCRRRSWTTGRRHAAACCTVRTTFPEIEPAGGQVAQVFQSSRERRQRERAAHVPAVDRRRARKHPAGERLLRAGRLSRADAGARGNARREGADHRPRTPHRRRGGPAGVPLPVGPAARGRRRRSTSTSPRCTTAR